MTAVGSGGLAGKGWLQGTQSHLEFLPEPYTDFIMAVIAEEFGWLGVVAVLALYAAVCVRGLVMAGEMRDAFARMLAGGLVLIFCAYALVNTAMVAGLLPVVGVPLPLISYGGSSAVTLAAGFGIVLALYRHRRPWS
jgi:rod shape determining protein RodA